MLNFSATALVDDYKIDEIKFTNYSDINDYPKDRPEPKFIP
jgi:hypothetical protein